MQLVFMGTPEFAVPTLELLASSSHEMLTVVTQPDRPKGRGRKVAAPPVKLAAESLGLSVVQPSSLKDEEFVNHLSELAPQLFVVVAFRVLPRTLLEIPTCGSVNLHASLLPKFRGAAPIHWAIIKGEEETGLTIFRLKPDIDTGDVLSKRSLSIGPDETTGELYSRMMELGSDMVLEVVDDIEAAREQAFPQDERLATRAPKLTKADSEIDWGLPEQALHNLVRGTNPSPGAFTFWKGESFRVHRTQLTGGPTGDISPGTVIAADQNSGLLVATGDGPIKLLEVQQAGKKKMDAVLWLRGSGVKPGDRFE